MKIFSIIVHTIFLALLAAVALLFLLPLLPIEQNLELRIVESGSMEPAITTGSLVLILPKETYDIGDVITFKSATADVPTTHRITDTYTENGRLWFITKGDANEEADTAAVARGDIIGTVRFDVPRAGYILDFARTPTGFMLLIVLPSVLLIISEIEKIWREIRRRKPPLYFDGDADDVKPVTISRVRSTAPKNRLMIDIATPIKRTFYPTLDLTKTVRLRSNNQQLIEPLKPVSMTVLLCTIIVGSSFFGSTVSYYNSVESSVDNALTAIELDFDVFPDDSNFAFDDGELVGDIDGAVVTVVAPTIGSVDTLYDITTEFMGGNLLFCDAIIASSTAPFTYGGPLSSLTAVDVAFPAPWSLAFSLPDSTDLSFGDTCLIDVVLTAWHFEEISNQGYFDEERVPLSFSLIPPFAIQSFVNLQADTLLIVSTTTASSTEGDQSDAKSDGGSTNKQSRSSEKNTVTNEKNSSSTEQVANSIVQATSTNWVVIETAGTTTEPVTKALVEKQEDEVEEEEEVAEEESDEVIEEETEAGVEQEEKEESEEEPEPEKVIKKEASD